MLAGRLPVWPVRAWCSVIVAVPAGFWLFRKDPLSVAVGEAVR